MKILKSIGLTMLIFFLSLTTSPLILNVDIQGSNSTLTVSLIVVLIFTVILCTMMILEELRNLRQK